MELKGAFWYSLEASEVSQSEKSIVDGLKKHFSYIDWGEKA